MINPTLLYVLVNLHTKVDQICIEAFSMYTTVDHLCGPRNVARPGGQEKGY